MRGPNSFALHTVIGSFKWAEFGSHSSPFTNTLIYSDEEGSLLSSTIRDYLKSENIGLHTTRGHPAFGERFTRTKKDMLQRQYFHG